MPSAGSAPEAMRGSSVFSSARTALVISTPAATVTRGLKVPRYSAASLAWSAPSATHPIHASWPCRPSPPASLTLLNTASIRFPAASSSATKPTNGLSLSPRLTKGQRSVATFVHLLSRQDQVFPFLAQTSGPALFGSGLVFGPGRVGLLIGCVFVDNDGGGHRSFDELVQGNRNGGKSQGAYGEGESDE